jgi:peptide-methionine (R)-S-oxide reductase
VTGVIKSGLEKAFMQLNEEEWKQKLDDKRYRVLRQKGTEAPFSGEHLNETRDGTFVCGGCGATLFDSSNKYESTMPGLAGWPSFSDVIGAGAVELVDDNSLGMHRTEVVCGKCGGHLGHVFDNDPDSSTGKHYCINSCSLDFKPKEAE